MVCVCVLFHDMRNVIILTCSLPQKDGSGFNVFGSAATPVVMKPISHVACSPCHLFDIQKRQSFQLPLLEKFHFQVKLRSSEPFCSEADTSGSHIR